MSMQSHANHGNLLKLDKETLSRFDKLDPRLVKQILTAAKVNPRFYQQDNPEVERMTEDFIADFATKYGILPDFEYLDDEVEGTEGAAESKTVFLFFSDTEKYIQTIRPEWEALPVKPEYAAWTTCS